MARNKKPGGKDGAERIVAEARHDRRRRQQQGYREQALRILPWVCARCGRDFQGRKLRELTVHHKDHDHNHNPPDGSNWELLCIYCHENQHARGLDQQWHAAESPGSDPAPGGTHKPFADLANLLKKKP